MDLPTIVVADIACAGPCCAGTCVEAVGGHLALPCSAHLDGCKTPLAPSCTRHVRRMATGACLCYPHLSVLALASFIVDDLQLLTRPLEQFSSLLCLKRRSPIYVNSSFVCWSPFHHASLHLYNRTGNLPATDTRAY